MCEAAAVTRDVLLLLDSTVHRMALQLMVCALTAMTLINAETKPTRTGVMQGNELYWRFLCVLFVSLATFLPSRKLCSP